MLAIASNQTVTIAVRTAGGTAPSMRCVCLCALGSSAVTFPCSAKITGRATAH